LIKLVSPKPQAKLINDLSKRAPEKSVIGQCRCSSTLTLRQCQPERRIFFLLSFYVAVSFTEEL